MGDFFLLCGVFIRVGEIHRRGDNYLLTLVLPSVLFCVFWFMSMCSMSGRIHRRGDIVFLLSFSPLWTGACVFWDVFCLYVGEIHRRGDVIFRFSFSPLWTGKSHVFLTSIYHPNFCAFLRATILWSLSHHVRYHSGGVPNRPHTMYIYSLGHFLTTKGALIDGDWGGSKKGHKTQKSDQNLLKIIKISKKWSKKVIKKWQKKHDS